MSSTRKNQFPTTFWLSPDKHEADKFAMEALQEAERHGISKKTYIVAAILAYNDYELGEFMEVRPENMVNLARELAASVIMVRELVSQIQSLPAGTIPQEIQDTVYRIAGQTNQVQMKQKDGIVTKTIIFADDDEEYEDE